MKTNRMIVSGLAAVVTVLGCGAMLDGARARGTQYAAFCTETQEHGGTEPQLSLGWHDSYDAANNDGKSHERATRGHRWRVTSR